MGHPTFGAFTLLVIVNGQDVGVTCSLCGEVRSSTVDRSESTEAAVQLHIATHIRNISEGYPWLPSTPVT